MAKGSKMRVLLAVPWDDRRGGVMAVVDNVATCLQAGGHDVVLFHSDRGARLTSKSTQLGFPGVALRLTMPFGGGVRGALRTFAFPFLFPIILAQLIWFRRVPADCVMTVTLGLAGFGEAYFYEMEIETVEGSAPGPVDQYADRPVKRTIPGVESKQEARTPAAPKRTAVRRRGLLSR